MTRPRPDLLRRGLLVALLLPAGLMAEAAEIDVTGFGWLQNRRLERALDRLRVEPEAEVLDANQVEDAVFFLISALTEDGYLQPELRVELTTAEGRRLTHQFGPKLEEILPRPLVVTRAEFRVTRGVRYTFEDVEVRGGTGVIDEEEIEALLLPAPEGLSLSPDLAFSPAALRRGAGRVEDALDQQGYAEARVEASERRRDDASGQVDVTVKVNAGPRWRVADIVIEGERPPGVEWPDLRERTDRPWNTAWEQDAVEAVRHALYAEGFADAVVSARRAAADPAGGIRQVRVTLSVTPGPKILTGPVRFEGDHAVAEAVLRRRVQEEPGEPLDPLRFDAARYRLARLGAFNRVDLHYEPADGRVRSPVFTLDSLPDWEVHLLAGYGSYEQVRGGIEVRRNNVLRRAHRARLELIQSLKSTRGEVAYTVPELFGELIDGNAQLFGLQREELAFVRQEFGSTISLTRRRLPWINADGTLSYTYQFLRNRENELTTRDVDTSETVAASIDFRLSRDRRDNPLQPREGYRWFAQAELAADALGGDVDYQRLEAGVSYHRPWGGRRWIHAALTHGVVLTLSEEDDRALPINRRFYPGGDSSIRGYQRGEAAPRGPDGRFIGAKSSTLLNLELEQVIVGRFTAVIFVDALGTTATLDAYPWDDHLISVGIGVRYQTIIGPVRLEYGHNLDPRPEDPSGTVHFSLGFPF